MKPATTSPRVIVFAGPNGAGKSTHAEAILAPLGIHTFVNADYIARGLAGKQTETVAIAAGRIMLKRLRELGAAKQDFAFESTLSSKTFLPFLKKLKAQGYHLAIYYFALTSSRLAVRRVKLRVSLGGHDVPADVVQRRYGRSLHNFFQLYAGVADEWIMFDNSSNKAARPVARQINTQLSIEDKALWLKLQKQSHA
jgi:predicted ABC-type ATPase